jgi:hypothetical protein
MKLLHKRMHGAEVFSTPSTPPSASSREVRTRSRSRADVSQTKVLLEYVRTRRRQISDVGPERSRCRERVGNLNGRVPHRDIFNDHIANDRRAETDSNRIPYDRIFLNEVVVPEGDSN